MGMLICMQSYEIMNSLLSRFSIRMMHAEILKNGNMVLKVREVNKAWDVIVHCIHINITIITIVVVNSTGTIPGLGA